MRRSASAQGCGFCAHGGGGTCIVKGGVCPEAAYSDAGCPSPYTPLIIVCVLLYLAAFAPGLGPVPWAVNSEIYPLQARLPCRPGSSTCMSGMADTTEMPFSASAGSHACSVRQCSL